MTRVTATLLAVTLVAGCMSTHQHPEATNRGFHLDRAIEQRILSPRFVTGIHDVRGVDYSEPPRLYLVSNEGRYDYLVIGVSLTGDFGFEGMWHGVLVARRPDGDHDWRRCQVFYLTGEATADELVATSETELSRYLSAYPEE